MEAVPNPDLTAAEAEALDRKHQQRKNECVLLKCQCCSMNLSDELRIKCMECDDVLLCINCLRTGKEMYNHKKTHKYQVLNPLKEPLFSPEWKGNEEAYLIEGIHLYGIGNWQDVAVHIGSKTKEEAEDHFNKAYLGIEQEGLRLPEMSPVYPQGLRQSMMTTRSVAEVAGFNVFRGDFESEYKEFAELDIQNIFMHEHDTPQLHEAKMRAYEGYNHVLEERNLRKKLMFDVGIADRNRMKYFGAPNNKENKDTVSQGKLRPVLRFLDAQKYLKLYQSIIDANHWQIEGEFFEEQRGKGCETMKETADYNKHVARGIRLVFEEKHRDLNQKGRLYKQSNLTDIPGAEFLHPDEAFLCRTAKVTPDRYSRIKTMLLSAHANGLYLTPQNAVEVSGESYLLASQVLSLLLNHKMVNQKPPLFYTAAKADNTYAAPSVPRYVPETPVKRTVPAPMVITRVAEKATNAALPGSTSVQIVALMAVANVPISSLRRLPSKRQRAC